MKRVVLALVLIFLLVVPFVSCSEEQGIEAYQIFYEYDDVEFSIEDFLDAMRQKEGYKVIETNSPMFVTDIQEEKNYAIGLDKKGMLTITVFADESDAKEYFDSSMKDPVLSVSTPLCSFIRIENVCIYFNPVSEENSVYFLNIMEELGLKKGKVKKINSQASYENINTDKSVDDIIEALENKGYSKVYSCEDYETVTTYNLISDSGEDCLMLYTMTFDDFSEEYTEMEPEAAFEENVKDMMDLFGNVEVIYSYNQETKQGILLLGNTADTDKIWKKVK
jgi:hypothetical protein